METQDQELQEVREALASLGGQIVRTVATGAPNHILEVSELGGFLVRARHDRWVPWGEITGVYERLKREGTWTNPRSGPDFAWRGAFVAAVLRELSTVEVLRKRNPRTLGYVPTGRPVKLRRKV